MRLDTFQITNFRSITDSGPVDASRITALLGRNESGKTNLLRALYSLNPAAGFKALNPIKDFPRHRRLEECEDKTPVVNSRWELDSAEQAELVEIFPRAEGVTHVTIGRRYDAIRTVGFEGLANASFDEVAVKSMVRKIVPAVKASAAKVEQAKAAPLEQAADAFESASAPVQDKIKWAQNIVAALKTLRTALAAADAELSDKQDQTVIELEGLSESIANDATIHTKARKWILERMPIFIFLDEYPELLGHQNVAEFVDRKKQGKATEADSSFEKLCKVAGLEPDKLHDLLAKKDQETRNQLANRAGAVVTSEIKRLWKDRPLKVRFNLDADHLDTLISDPNATYEVEVNLNERSRGFQWFFSFYITFSADTKGGDAEDAILLLDEPGLYLHAKSQADLLSHFEKDFENQIIYTTHSPFMVPTHNLDTIRTVNITEEGGTVVSNNPTGDSRTLFPLQAALGYSIAQSLFVGGNNLVVEGVTDFWFLSSVSGYLADAGNGRTALNADLTITPAGGAPKVQYMVALLSSEELNVLVLLDEEKDARTEKDNLVKSKLISENSVTFVSEAFQTPPKEADVEDLLEPSVYEALVRESYAAELAGKTLSLNTNIPRIAKRVEAGMQGIGIEFHKTRPARLFLKKIATDSKSVLTDRSLGQFEALFKTINTRFNKQLARKSATK